MNNLIVKIYGDSLSLPRPQDCVDYGEEYGYKLKLLLEEDLKKIFTFGTGLWVEQE
ncbi:MAG: hypothetical protein GYA35_06835 [Thermoanaerobaculaceae bacterium]|nr:hypothetical protein [Thermoanaerobaculaceae bacterium]